jgi:catechol 2,3-dioxygenase-like lactoylglutathione lyase family enzyme
MVDRPQGLSPLEGVLEAAIYMSDLEKAREFYGGLLGLEEVIAVEGRHVFFRCGTTIVLVFNPAETLKQPFDGALPVPPHGASGASHICFSASGTQVDSWKILLQQKGVAIESEITWPNGGRSFYFRDPEGNSLEIAQPGLWGYEEKVANL